MSRPTPIVGRDEELTLLQETLEPGARTGNSLLIVGEPGIGKTTLLSVVRQMGRDHGATVLSTVGVEAESTLPFAGLQQMLIPLLDGVTELQAPHRQALLTAFGLESGPQPSLFLIAEAVVDLLQRADNRVVVVADDVQWLDNQTDEILAYLGRRAHETWLTVIGAARVGHTSVFIAAGFNRLEVEGLSIEAGRELLGRAAVGLTIQDQNDILAEARGNPLALLELPGVWEPGSIDEHPPLSSRLERAFGSRISELPSPTRDALLVAAVDSRDDLAEIVAATAVLSGERPRPLAFDAACEASLIVVKKGRLQFRHPLVRSGVLQTESVGRRHAAHAAVAQVLTDDPFRRTWHRGQSIVGPDDAIADELEATVADLVHRGAVMTAVASLERAAELSSDSPARGHRLLVAAEHAFSTGRVDVVDRLVREAARTELSELDWARMQWLREIFEDGTPGDAVRVIELCDIARRSAAADDIDLALNLLLGAALRCWWAETGPAARAEVASVVCSLPDDTSADPRSVAALAVAEPVLRASEVTARLSTIDLAAVTDADELRLYGMAAHAIGDSVLATDLLDRSEARLREFALLGLLPHVLGMQVHIRTELGDWAGARSARQEVRRLALDSGQPIWLLNNEILDAEAKALLGDWEGALTDLERLEVEATRRQLNVTLALLVVARATALLVAQRPVDAYRPLRRLFEPGDSAHHTRESFGSIALFAETAVAAGETDDAREVLAQMEALTTITPSPILGVNLLYARAVLAVEPGVAEANFRAALEFDLGRWPWLAARIHAAYGEWLLHREDLRAARDHLQQAHATFVALGAATWAGHAEDLLAEGQG